MAKVTAQEIVKYLENAGASKEDIPTLVMTAFYESNFETEAQNDTTKAIGLFQINASSFYDDNNEPDPSLSKFFKSTGNTLSESDFEEALKDPQYNANFAISYLNDVKANPEQFPIVRDNNNNPFSVWEGYTDYVEPYLNGQMPKGRGSDAAGQKSDVIAGINAYVDAFYSTGSETLGEEPQASDAPDIEAPEVVGGGDFRGGLGQERRIKNFTEREIVSFERSRDKIAQKINPSDPTNPETIRQSSLMLASLKGLDTAEIPIDVRSNYSELDTVILNFLGELSKKKVEGAK